MVQASQPYNRFHNFERSPRADAIGQADAVLKGAEAEVKALKEEFKARGLSRPPASASPSPGRTNQQPSRRHCREAVSRRRLAQV